MLQAAIIGCGVIAPAHRSALLLDGRAEIRWACDSDVAKARATIPAQRHSADYREALADPAVDLVCICTPHADHCTPMTDALAAGKHVICEKPLGTTPDQVRRMVAAAEAGAKRGLVAAGIFQHRFNPLASRLRELLRAGDFGAVAEARMDFRCTRDAGYYAAGAWRGTWAGEGGALLINQAIHTIDLVNWFCGEPEAVSGRVARRRLGAEIECEDHAEFAVRYRGGAKAAFSAVNDGTSGWVTDIHVRCARGSFSLGKGCYALTALDHPSNVLKAELRAFDRLRDEVVKLEGAAGKSEYGDFHALQIADALSAIQAKRAPRVTIADAAMSPLVVQAVYHSSAREGAEVLLPLVDYRHPVLTSTASALKGT
jgi:predicted dehydrogenase